jgi:hypothetical protein
MIKRILKILAVLVIIASALVFAFLTYFHYNNPRDKALELSIKNKLTKVSKIAEIYKTKNGSYGPATSNCITPGTLFTNSDIINPTDSYFISIKDVLEFNVSENTASCFSDLSAYAISIRYLTYASGQKQADFICADSSGFIGIGQSELKTTKCPADARRWIDDGQKPVSEEYTAISPAANSSGSENKLAKLNFTSPTTQDKWILGKSYNINWNTDEKSELVYLSLVYYGSGPHEEEVKFIGSTDIGKKSFNWIVPGDMYVGKTNYIIMKRTNDIYAEAIAISEPFEITH